MSSRRGPIVLTTDFGTAGYHVGVMKGVILSRNPDAAIVDLCHGIAPGDIAAGAWTLLWNWRFFPPGTIHVAVVDPGVGTSRRPLAGSAGGQFFLGPDNGLLSPVLAGAGPGEAVTLSPAGEEGGEVSKTFHGRDVFAPAAAALSLGTPLAALGAPAEGIVGLDLPRPGPVEGGGLCGEVIAVDPFGNLVTNITAGDLESAGIGAGARVLLDGRDFGPLGHCYGDAPEGEALALLNSSGHLELAVNRGRADSLPGAAPGVSVTVR